MQHFLAVDKKAVLFVCVCVCVFPFFSEENDHLKAENRSLKKDLLTAIENASSGSKKVPLKGE